VQDRVQVAIDHVEWLDALPLIRPTYSCAHASTFLLTYTVTYKTGSISETVEDKTKVTINGLYKIGHGLSIAAKMYDLE